MGGFRIMMAGGGEKMWSKVKALPMRWLLVPVVALILWRFSQVSCSHTPVEPWYRGRRVSDWLRNENVLNAYNLGIKDLLRLKQITTGDEPQFVTFELPIKYDVLRDIGDLMLFVDGNNAFCQEIARATNGSCLVLWNTTFEPPGRRNLHVCLYVTKGLSTRGVIKVVGPELVFVSSNVLQFNPFYSEYGRSGAILYAKLAGKDATYRLEIQSEAGHRLKVICGSTTNGVIEEHWDLVDETGHIYTNDSFDCIFNVELADGRSGQYIQTFWRAGVVLEAEPH